MAKEDQSSKPQHETVVIHIDHKQYKTEKETLAGADLRLLAEPHIGQEYNLWLEIPGPGDDDLIEDGVAVPLRNGMQFYSVLKQINPGNRHAVV